MWKVKFHQKWRYFFFLARHDQFAFANGHFACSWHSIPCWHPWKLGYHFTTLVNNFDPLKDILE